MTLRRSERSASEKTTCVNCYSATTARNTPQLQLLHHLRCVVATVFATVPNKVPSLFNDPLDVKNVTVIMLEDARSEATLSCG